LYVLGQYFGGQRILTSRTLRPHGGHKTEYTADTENNSVGTPTTMRPGSKARVVRGVPLEYDETNPQITLDTPTPCYIIPKRGSLCKDRQLF
jgi:hypothetical protein